jgi:hypothetical protein
MKQLFNLLIFLAICFVVYMLFRNTSVVEGAETMNTGITGLAGGAADYVTRLTDAVTRKTDVLLIDKYRTEYENAIMKADDLINVLMLEQVMSIDTSKPQNSIMIFGQIAALSHAKDGLTKTLKFVDNAKSKTGVGGFFG